MVYVNAGAGPTFQAPNDPTIRQLERDTGTLTNPNNPYSGVNNEQIAAYQAGSVEQQILHIIDADPLRTPTYALFPKPDYYFGLTATCTAANQSACISNLGNVAPTS